MKYVTLALLLTLAATSCKATETEPEWGRALDADAAALLPLGPDDRAPSVGAAWHDRDQVLISLEHSLDWIGRPHAPRHFPKAGITHDRMARSLAHLKNLLQDSPNASAFDAAVQRDYVWFKSAGWDGLGGGVLVTGYGTPILMGSNIADKEHRFPLYGLPGDLAKAADGSILGRMEAGTITGSYPDRQAINAGFLTERKLELVWLHDPIDALLAHVNGSAFVRLQDGTMLRLGYAGKNGHDYTSVGQQLVNDGWLTPETVSLNSIRAWAAQNPGLVEAYVERNASYVFFQQIEGNPHGSLDVEVTAERSLATDKRLFPRAAPVFVTTELGSPSGAKVPFQQLLFDQDTGGAIRTAGRADIYLGIGPSAEQRAGSTKSQGQLYYFFLRENQP